jgi:inhibitor of KinA sporulation pathway (predicted exonuclease)
MDKRGGKGGRPRDSPDVQISKNLSYLLRHGAVEQGLIIRADGYIKLDDIFIVILAKQSAHKVDVAKVKEIVDSNDRKRFELKTEVEPTGPVLYIRAVQGHSIAVDVEVPMQIEEVKEALNPGQQPANQVTEKLQVPEVPEKPLDYIVVLDFEAQCQENVTLNCQEIIEFPSVIVDVKAKKVVDIFHHYIKPVVHPALYPVCTKLTGITQEQVDKGMLLEKALEELDKFLVKNNILGTSWVFLTCGHWDLQQCLRKECIYKNIQVKDYMRNWINIKENYPLPPDYKGRKPDMVEMLELSKIPLDGRHHSGIDDTII